MPDVRRARTRCADVRGAARRRRRSACPRCDCGEPLKPDVVLFGELLPEEALERAHALAAGADLLLCVGSSLEVHPIAQLPGVTRASGRQRRDRHRRARRRGTTRAAVKLDGDVVAELEAVLAALWRRLARSPAPMRARSAASTRAEDALDGPAVRSSSRPPCSAAFAAAPTAPRSLAQLGRCARRGRARSAHGASSASAASSATRSCSAASRRRPASTSGAARSAAPRRPARRHGRPAARRAAPAGAARRAALPPRRGGRGSSTASVQRAVRDLLAVAVADAHHQRLLAADLAHVRVHGRDAVRVQDRVERRAAAVVASASPSASPSQAPAARLRRAARRRRASPGPSATAGWRLGRRPSRVRRPRRAAGAAARRACSRTSTCAGSPGVAAQHVAAVGRAERPGELELDEGEVA